MDGFASVTDAVETTGSLGIGLPTFQPGHIELSITRIYPCPHRTAGKVDWNAGYPTLHLAILFLLEHHIEFTLTIGHMKELILQGTPLVAGDPDLPTAGIVHSALLGHPDQWLGCFLWEMLKAWSIHKCPAILPPI